MVGLCVWYVTVWWWCVIDAIYISCAWCECGVCVIGDCTVPVSLISIHGWPGVGLPVPVVGWCIGLYYQRVVHCGGPGVAWCVPAAGGGWWWAVVFGAVSWVSGVWCRVGAGGRGECGLFVNPWWCGELFGMGIATINRHAYFNP